VDQPLLQQRASKLVADVQTALESAFAAVDAQALALVELQEAIREQEQRRNLLRAEVSTLEAKQTTLTADNEKALTDVSRHLADMQERIQKAQDTYEYEVKRLHTLRNEADEEQEAKEAALEFREKKLQERDTALRAKTDAFLQERADFETEKRRFRAEMAL
jgi:chromosome segregation ATPase